MGPIGRAIFPMCNILPIQFTIAWDDALLASNLVFRDFMQVLFLVFRTPATTSLCFHFFASRFKSFRHAASTIRRIQNPDIQRAGRGGAAHGRVAGRSGARQVRTPADQFPREITDHPALLVIDNNCPECVLGSLNKGIHI